MWTRRIIDIKKFYEFLFYFILFYRIKTQNNALKYDAWLTQKLRVFHAEITREKRVKNAWKTREYPMITRESRGEHAGISPFLTSGDHSIPNLMLYLNLFAEFSLLFTF